MSKPEEIRKNRPDDWNNIKYRKGLEIGWTTGKTTIELSPDESFEAGADALIESGYRLPKLASPLDRKQTEQITGTEFTDEAWEDIEKIIQVLQPLLASPDIREKIKEICTGESCRNIPLNLPCDYVFQIDSLSCEECRVNQLEALLQAKVEEAKEQEAQNIIKCIKDAKRVHNDWKIDDIIYLLEFREDTRKAVKGQSLQGGS